MILDTQAAVMANFEFLAQTGIDMEEEENDGEEEIYDSNTDTKQKVNNDILMNFCKFIILLTLRKLNLLFSFFQSSILLSEDVDAEAEEVLNQLNLLSEHEESIIHVDMDTNDWGT